MRSKQVFLGTLVLAVLLSGCSGIAPTGDTTTTTADAPRHEMTKTTTAARTTTVSDDEPEKGDNLLSVTRIDNETAMKHDASSRVSFSRLTERQRELFLQALRCDCNVNQNAFAFNDEDRITVVQYGGEYYYLRVSVV